MYTNMCAHTPSGHMQCGRVENASYQIPGSSVSFLTEDVEKSAQTRAASIRMSRGNTQVGCGSRTGHLGRGRRGTWCPLPTACLDGTPGAFLTGRLACFQLLLRPSRHRLVVIKSIKEGPGSSRKPFQNDLQFPSECVANPNLTVS